MLQRTAEAVVRNTFSPICWLTRSNILIRGERWVSRSSPPELRLSAPSAIRESEFRKPIESGYLAPFIAAVTPMTVQAPVSVS
jgi:hypothetical protein